MGVIGKKSKSTPGAHERKAAVSGSGAKKTVKWGAGSGACRWPEQNSPGGDAPGGLWKRRVARGCGGEVKKLRGMQPRGGMIGLGNKGSHREKGAPKEGGKKNTVGIHEELAP